MRTIETLTDILLEGGEVRPAETAFSLLSEDAPPNGITRSELLDRGLRIANGFKNVGVGVGDRVVLLGDPSPNWVSAFAGVVLAGGVPLPVHPKSTGPELERVAALSEASHAVFDPRALLERGRGAQIGTCRNLTWEPDDLAAASIAEMLSLDPAVPVAPRPSDPAVVLQTSGTTGTPKCVVQTHESHAGFVRRWTALTMVPEDRILNFLPLNHQGGLLLSWLSAFGMGCPTYQLERFSVAAFWNAVRQEAITWTILMQPVPRYLLDAPPTDYDRSHHLRFVDGSARPEAAAEIERRFGIRLIRPYGSTETTVVTMSLEPERVSLEGLDPEAIAACAGPPLDNWRIRVVDAAGKEVPAFVTGDLEVNGPGLFAGYLNDSDATTQAFTEDKWFRTGDRVYLSGGGELFFVERAGNAIRRSGENISAAEVEAVLEEHPEVAEVCVVAVPDDLRGQEVRACVVRVPGSMVTAEDLFDHCLGSLAKFKVPRYVDFWPALPRTPTFKVSRSQLASDPRTWADRYTSASAQ